MAPALATATMSRRAVTLAQVARDVGVSITSVSDILQRGQRDRYRPDTVEKVCEAAQRLGYQADAAARLLRQGNSRLVGIAVRTSVLGREIVNALAVAVEAELVAQGYQPTLIDPAQMVPSNSSTPFPSPGLLAGIISADLAMESDVPDFYNTLRSRLPIVAVYPLHSADVDSVTTDRARAMEMAVNHLVGLGHRRIAFADLMQADSVTSEAKFRGWRQAVEKLHLEVPAGYEILVHENCPVSEYGRSVTQGLPKLTPAPTALVCGSDEIALSTIRFLTAQRVRLPDELSITGYNGGPQGEFCYPPLTTVAQPSVEIARAAVARLLELMRLSNDGESWQPRQQLLEPELVVRESTVRVSS